MHREGTACRRAAARRPAKKDDVRLVLVGVDACAASSEPGTRRVPAVARWTF